MDFKIAIVHDYLAQDGGAERVLKSFHEIWPEAPIFVLFHDADKIPYLKKESLTESFLSKFPFIRSHYQWYLPLMPVATERYRLHDFDVVLSSTSSFAKGVITSPDTLHISYCHTPPRYLWADTHQYMSDLPVSRVVKFFLPRLTSTMRLWDKMSADRVDHFIANSKTVQNRIQKYYRRTSEVIHPPVEVDTFSIKPTVNTYFVTGGRLVPYKSLDIAVQAFNRLRWPLKIFGIGPELARLRRMAKPHIEFVGKITDAEKAELLGSAQAFIHPQVEDFGITALESMAAGRPVIAYAQGGATETVLPGETGIFFHEQTWESLIDTLLSFKPEIWDPVKIREHAYRFSDSRFKQAMQEYVTNRFEEFKRGLNQSSLFQNHEPYARTL